MDFSLADFPSEILAEITLHLHGFHILRMLHLTGSTILWHKLLHGGVAFLELNRELSEKSDIQKISTFKGLLSLHVIWYGIDPSECGGLLDVLPVSLTQLHMTHGLGEAGWIRPQTEKEAGDLRNLHFTVQNSIVVNLGERLPHLRHLSLSSPGWLRRWTPKYYWSPGMMIAFLRMLPRNLVSLHMDNIHECDLPYLSYLPPHLTKLTKTLSVRQSTNPPILTLPETLESSLHEYSIEIPKDGAMPILPPYLTSLTCAGGWDRLFSSTALPLPHGLTSLTLVRGKTWVSNVLTDLSLTYLPPTLKILILDQQVSECTDAAQWPPLLTKLALLSQNETLHAKNLPKSLTSFSLTNSYHRAPFDFSSLPQSLRSFSTNITISSSDEIQQLPRNITRLSITIANPNQSITCWPPSLLSLTMASHMSVSYWTTKNASTLPKTLTHLEVSGMADFAVQALPLSMIHLQMQRVEITGLIPMNFEPTAPADTVIIPMQIFFDPLRFRALPPGSCATDPSVCDPSMRQPFNTKRCMSMDAHLPLHAITLASAVQLVAFPPHVTALELHHPLPASPKTLAGILGLLVNLKSLLVNLSYSFEPCDMTGLTNLDRLNLIGRIPPDLETHMPPNLTELSIAQSNDVWRGPLPINLRKLEAPTIFSVLKPLKQLESLTLRNYFPQNFSSEKGDFLDLIDALPCLTRLEASSRLKQSHLEALVKRKRKITLAGMDYLEIDSPERISPIWGIKLLESPSLAQSIHQAVLNYYPHLPTLMPKAIYITFRDEKCWRDVSTHVFFPHLTVLKLGTCIVPDRFARWLPRTITDLDINEANGTTHRTTPGLPPSLTRLSIRGTGFSLLSYQQLPRSITELEFSFQRKFWPKYAKALPPSLRILTLDVTYTSNKMIAELPRTITSLDFGTSARTITGPALKNLPPNLTSLGGSFHSIPASEHIEALSKILHINSYDRSTSTDYEARLSHIQNALASTSLDELASHLLQQ